MLVHGNRIVVIGFSYRVGGTEIGLFTLHKDGRITHDATHFLRSNDYYSSRNYASRLVGSRLIFYMPYTLPIEQKSPLLPGVASWQARERRAGPWRDILRSTDVYRPVQATLRPTLHTVVECDLALPTFSCSARAVVGPFARTFYVSQEAVYLWVAPGFYEFFEEEKPKARVRDAFVYRLPLGRGDITALRARGTPIDQFSFKEGEDRFLNVVLTSHGGGDFMWAPERAGGSLALLRVPLAIFSPEAQTAPPGAYTQLPRPSGGYSLQNRFVGSHVLVGSGHGWWGGGPKQGELVVADVRRPSEAKVLKLAHGVDRIEAMGGHAVTVGGSGADLHFTAVELGREPVLRGTFVQPGASQGETRSHGFFFLPAQGGGGLLGLPLRKLGRPGHHLIHGSAEVLFLRVSPELAFARLGSLAARAPVRENDACEVSCVDWYGNARPIFYRGRIFALLGYELVEGQLRGSRLDERRRVHFLVPGRPLELAH